MATCKLAGGVGELTDVCGGNAQVTCGVCEIDMRLAGKKLKTPTLARRFSPFGRLAFDLSRFSLASIQHKTSNSAGRNTKSSHTCSPSCPPRRAFMLSKMSTHAAVDNSAAKNKISIKSNAFGGTTYMFATSRTPTYQTSRKSASMLVFPFFTSFKRPLFFRHRPRLALVIHSDVC